jgi:hypothetical protein
LRIPGLDNVDLALEIKRTRADGLASAW